MFQSAQNRLFLDPFLHNSKYVTLLYITEQYSSEKKVSVQCSRVEQCDYDMHHSAIWSQTPKKKGRALHACTPLLLQTAACCTALLHSTDTYYTTQHCTLLICTIPYNTTLHCTVLNWPKLYYMAIQRDFNFEKTYALFQANLSICFTWTPAYVKFMKFIISDLRFTTKHYCNFWTGDWI